MKDENILFEIKKLHLAIGRRLFSLHQDGGTDLCPSPLQMEVLSILLNRGDAPVFLKDIQEELGISKAAISDVIWKMEKKGFIEKKSFDGDGRKIQILLLENGRKAYAILEENATCVRKEMIEGVSSKDLDVFLKVSKKFQSNLEKEDELC